MPVPPISQLPVAPQVSDTPSVFSQRANTFVAALSTLVTETNATTAEINAAVAGNLVQFDGYKGVWEAGTFDAGDLVFYAPTQSFFISLEDGNDAEPPGGDWQQIGNALSTSYDNTASGLDATNVQAAIDEVAEFDPSNVALTETTVKGAVSELCTLPPLPKTESYTLTAADTGGLVSITSGTITVPAGVFDAGDTVVVYNNAANSRTIARASGVTMYWIDGINTDRELLQRGLATIVCVGSNEFVITGQGLS